jgi:uncharacterized protein YcbX
MDAHPPVGSEVGRVAAIRRYPVKSMAAEPLDRATVSWHGVAGDRRWAFVRRGDASGFPWHTIRDQPAMVRYAPRLADPDRPDASAVTVTSPGGVTYDVAEPALAAELGDDVYALRLNRGTFDTLPLSLLTVQSIAGLEALAARSLHPERFRPNLVVDVPGGDDFPEDAWPGCTLQIGEALVRVDGRDQRCVVVNVDPLTAERDPVVLGTIARERRTRFGVYATTVRPGVVAVGDAVVVVARDADV